MAAKKSSKAKKPVKASGVFNGLLRNSALWVAIVLILAGVLFILGGANGVMDILKWIVLIIGILVAIVGVVNIVGQFYLIGIVETIVGIALAVLAFTIVKIALLVFGIALLVYGIVYLIKKRHWTVWVPNVVVGAILVLFYFGSGLATDILNIFSFIVGALMIVDGVMSLIAIFRKK